MKIENVSALARKNESNDKYFFRNIELSMLATEFHTLQWFINSNYFERRQNLTAVYFPSKVCYFDLLQRRH
jgi:hypothetical protein